MQPYPVLLSPHQSEYKRAQTGKNSRRWFIFICVEHLARHMGLQTTIYLFVIAQINETESLYLYSHLLYCFKEAFF